MAEIATCPSCEKVLRWKPELVGRIVQCTCGEVFTVPETPVKVPDRVSLSDFETDDVAPPEPLPEMKCPSCNLPLKRGAMVCINCGYNRETGRKIKTAVGTDADVPAPLKAPLDQRPSFEEKRRAGREEES